MPKLLKGTVVSDKMSKTVVVSVGRLAKHPKYKRYYKTTKRYKAHDGAGMYHVGDEVLIRETKPISRDKRWLVVGMAKRQESVPSATANATPDVNESGA
ncbi:MAG: 30S ribosomal protein S17 [bacterium]|nr:30S ribosomal protein S17 [bacterium]MDZ4295887.1 30S ribosomal protein S17 [Patescibacteria group bacterium]